MITSTEVFQWTAVVKWDGNVLLVKITAFKMERLTTHTPDDDDTFKDPHDVQLETAWTAR